MWPEIYLVKVNSPLDENTFQYLIKFVQPEKRGRILKQKIKQKADNMLIGEIVAKMAIKECFGIDFKRQKFTCTNRGKPYLPDYPHVHFNITHSGEYVACCVSDKPVGIDIQKTGVYKPDVAKRVCNEKELKQIEASADKASEFTRLWTQKEAVLKMRGTGIGGENIKNCTNECDIQTEKIEDYWISVTENTD